MKNLELGVYVAQRSIEGDFIIAQHVPVFVDFLIADRLAANGDIGSNDVVSKYNT